MPPVSVPSRCRLLPLLTLTTVLCLPATSPPSAAAQSHPVFLEPSAIPDSAEAGQQSGTNCDWHAATFEGYLRGGIANFPPDPNGAVGPDYLVSIGNSQIAWHLKDGTSECESDLSSFFTTIATGSPFDPRVVYDTYEDRFVVIAIEESVYGPYSHILVAVSSTGNPNDEWYFQRIDSFMTISGHEALADFPQLAVDDSAVYITA